MNIGQWVIFYRGNQTFTGYVVSRSTKQDSVIIRKTLRLENGKWRPIEPEPVTVATDTLLITDDYLETDDYRAICELALEHKDKKWFDIITSKMKDKDGDNVVRV